MRLYDIKQTRRLAKEFAAKLRGNETIFLIGELGSGKTTFVRNVLSTMNCRENVHSPTFTLLNIYNCYSRIYHFDLYRLKSPNDLWEIGFYDYVQYPGIKFIEWPEIILNENLENIKIYFVIEPDTPDKRGIKIDYS